MSAIDWAVLLVTLAGIVAWGVWKGRGQKNIEGYLLADKSLPWYHVGLSVIATQASAITFLSAPGLAFSKGMGFVQFYFGLPLAMIVLCITFVPIFHKLNVYTAYEYLEGRFDIRTRSLTAGLFLVQRGVSTGITIYAPSIVLSTILGIDITYTTLILGVLVICYITWGGAKAASYTQLLQMLIIFSGLIVAAVLVVKMLPADVGLSKALHLAGTMGRVNAIDTSFDLTNKYNLWSGLVGGFFLQLSYFGTDQSQVGRYLTGASVKQSRLGLIMNGLVKIPMQAFILFIGVLVFAFYQFQRPPLFFNPVEVAKVKSSSSGKEYAKVEEAFEALYSRKAVEIQTYNAALDRNDKKAVALAGSRLQAGEAAAAALKKQATDLMKKADKSADTDDTNYVFLGFVTHYLPVGMIGLLMAVIFLASMGSTASGLNSLASTTVVDVYKRLIHKEGTDKEYLTASRWATAGWGVFCVGVALWASKLGNLIEAVNILGSLFYGTILGIFVVAFYLKKVGGQAVFWGAILAEVFVVGIWLSDVMAFLWLNVVGCVLVVVFALLLQLVFEKPVKDLRG